MTKNLIMLIFIFISCSNDGNTSVNSQETEIQPYYGTYLYTDEECLGCDIQYLTTDMNGIIHIFSDS